MNFLRLFLYLAVAVVIMIAVMFIESVFHIIATDIAEAMERWRRRNKRR